MPQVIGALPYTRTSSRPRLQAIIDRGGKLRTNWTGISGGLTLIQLDWGWLLVQLGEVADYLLGLRPRRKGAVPERISGVDQFTVMLQVSGMSAGGRCGVPYMSVAVWLAVSSRVRADRRPAHVYVCMCGSLRCLLLDDGGYDVLGQQQQHCCR